MKIINIYSPIINNKNKNKYLRVKKWLEFNIIFIFNFYQNLQIKILKKRIVESRKFSRDLFFFTFVKFQKN